MPRPSQSQQRPMMSRPRFPRLWPPRQSTRPSGPRLSTPEKVVIPLIKALCWQKNAKLRMGVFSSKCVQGRPALADFEEHVPKEGWTQPKQKKQSGLHWLCLSNRKKSMHWLCASKNGMTTEVQEAPKIPKRACPLQSWSLQMTLKKKSSFIQWVAIKKAQCFFFVGPSWAHLILLIGSSHGLETWEEMSPQNRLFLQCLSFSPDNDNIVCNKIPWQKINKAKIKVAASVKLLKAENKEVQSNVGCPQDGMDFDDVTVLHSTWQTTKGSWTWC